MSRKRTRRKVYQLVNPITHAIAGACITDTAALDKIRLSELTSLEAFRTGHATKHDWRVLADMLNVSETLARDGIGPEAMGANLSAQEALGAVQDRSKQHNGRLVLTGPELQALRDAFEYADLQRSSISRSRLEDAIRRTAARIASAHTSVKVYI
jgi:hypothetical protein